MNVLFWRVKNKIDKKGMVPLYCRITIDGERCEFSTKIRIKSDSFDSKRQRIRGMGEMVRSQNEVLYYIRHRLMVYYNQETAKGNKPTPTNVRSAYLKL